MATVAELLKQAQMTFEERNKSYGSSYEKQGKVMTALYPDGITLKTEEDFNRFGVINMIISKICRYSNNFKDGHLDSVHDLGVYSFILQELDIKMVESLKSNKQFDISTVQHMIPKKPSALDGILKNHNESDYNIPL